MFQIKVVQKIKKTHVMFITISRKSCRLCDNVEKYGEATEAADSNMVAHCMLD
jgi:hypothetical protein